MISQITDDFKLDFAAEQMVGSYGGGLQELISIWLRKKVSGSVGVSEIQKAVSWASDVLAHDALDFPNASNGKAVLLRDLRNELASRV